MKIQTALLAIGWMFTVTTPVLANPILVDIGELEKPKLFTTEVKVDENVINNSQRGHDLFLRDGENFNGPSSNFNWTSDQEYTWSLSYDGDKAKLGFENWLSEIDVSNDAPWDAFILRLSARNKTNDANQSIFNSASVKININKINGLAASGLTEFTQNLDGVSATTLGLKGGGVISALTGTVKFTWDSGTWDSSPSGLLAFQIKALDSPLTVPEPTSLALLGLGLAGLGFTRRRRKT